MRYALTSYEKFLLTPSVFCISQFTLRESLLDKFVLSSDQRDEGNRKWQSLSSSSATDFKTWKKIPFKIRMFCCIKQMVTWNQDFQSPPLVILLSWWLLLNYWLFCPSSKFKMLSFCNHSFFFFKQTLRLRLLKRYGLFKLLSIIICTVLVS